MKKIYLDYAATTPMDPLVKRTMAPYFCGKFGNPSSLHSFGQTALAAVDQSREKIAAAVGADFREIIFTGSATEANNLALRGVVRAAWQFSDGTGRPLAPAASGGLDSRLDGPAESGNQARRSSETFRTKTAKPPYRIIISKIEHDSILETARDLERDGIEVIYLPVNKKGVVDLEKLKKSLNERTILVSIMYANNEIGTIQPIVEVAKIINKFRKQRRSENNLPFPYPLFHTDAVQAFQFLDCDVNRLDVDLMTLSAHKIYGPKGAGALYVKNQNSETDLMSPIITGGEQEFNLRSGTENVPAIVGFAEAAALVVKNREKEIKRIRGLADYLWKELKKICPRAEINGSAAAERLPNILNIYFPNQNAGDLPMKLDLSGVAVSSGSACSTRAAKPSHVLKALGLNDKRIRDSIRFSSGKFTTKEEIKKIIKIMKFVL
jgi:cysteine desulfurase